MKDGADVSKVLLVDDDDTFRRVLASELARRGHSVESAATGAQALERCGTCEADVVLLDLRLPDMGGVEVLEELRAREMPAGVVVLTGHGTIDTAIKAIRLGAYDYLEKPCPIDKVEMAIRKTREHLGLLRRQRVLQDGYSPPDVRPGLVGASKPFEELCATVMRIAATDATTLILGETGVGKDMVAKLLHTESPRSEGPLVVVDCASLHEDLLQSELFGHEKGAFSGAARKKHGLFEVADGGTLFLDEVGEMSLEMQSKLLRVLETGRFRHLGGTKEIAVDVRVVSATNRAMQRELEQGRFRQDLYFRLATLTVEVPPLRERIDDIPLLVQHFTERLDRRLSRSCHLSAEALELFLAYSWPGNVRELIHVLEQAILLCPGDVIDPEDLPERLREGSPHGPAGGAPLPLREVEQRHVLAVLRAVGGNRARASQLLGISERHLYRLIKKHGWKAAGTAKDGARDAT
jgi:DNA-binding NtrC family response regulator